MPANEIIHTLDQILAALDTVQDKNKASMHAYIGKLSQLLDTLPPASFADIEDPEIRAKVRAIWKRSFVRHQGIMGDHEFIHGGIKISCRDLMIEHGFYVDYWQERGRGILFDCFAVTNPKLVPAIVDKLWAAGTLQNVLQQRVRIKDIDGSFNIFEFIERRINNSKQDSKPRSKQLQWQRFAEELIIALARIQVAHGFSQNFEYKLTARKLAATRTILSTASSIAAPLLAPQARRSKPTPKDDVTSSLFPGLSSADADFPQLSVPQSSSPAPESLRAWWAARQHGVEEVIEAISPRTYDALAHITPEPESHPAESPSAPESPPPPKRPRLGG